MTADLKAVCSAASMAAMWAALWDVLRAVWKDAPSVGERVLLRVATMGKSWADKKVATTAAELAVRWAATD